MVDRESCDTLLEDIVEKLLSWKHKNDEIVLAQDFNDDIYSGNTAEQLDNADLNMTEQIFKTTGAGIPPSTGSLLLLALDAKLWKSSNGVQG